MGTEVQSKGYLPGYHSMRDLNEDSNSCSWPLFYEDNTLSNGHYNGFLPMVLPDAYDKDDLKEKILEHETLLKNQVYELHRVYRIQKGLMEEIKMKEHHINRIPTESSFSSSPLRHQTKPEGVQKWQSPILYSPNAVDGRSSISGASATASPLGCIREKNAQTSYFPFQNEGSSRNSDVLESRPPKVRRKLLDLELPASEYIDIEDGEHAKEENVSSISTYPNNRNYGNHDSGVRISLNSGGKADIQVGASALQRKNWLTDLNEPFQMEGTNSAVVGSVSQGSCQKEILHMEPKSQFMGLPKEAVLNSHHFNGMPDSLQFKTDKSWSSRLLQEGCNNGNINTDLCRDERKPGSQAHERIHETSSAVRMNSVMASPISAPYSGVLLNMPHPCLHGVPSWETQKGGLSLNMTTHMHQSFNSSFGTSSQPSRQSRGIFSNEWHTNRSNLNLGSELLKQNEFYFGSSSDSKELPINFSSRDYGYPSCSININATSEHLSNPCYAESYNGAHVMPRKLGKDLNLNAAPPNSLSIEMNPKLGKYLNPNTVPPNSLPIEHFSGKTVEVIDLEGENDGILPWLRSKKCVYNGLHVMNPKIEKNLNLNAVPPNSLSVEQFSGRTVEVIDLESKNDGILPWLRPKSACNKEETKVGGDSKSGKLTFLYSPNQSLMKKESEKVSSSHYASHFSKNDAKRTEISDPPKIFGVPIFEKPCTLKSESKFGSPASASSLSYQCHVQENKRIKLALDINLPCDPDADLEKQITCAQAVEKGKDTNGSIFRQQFDLNSFANEDENCVVSHVPTTTEKFVVDIDLEAPYIPESEDDITLEGPVTMMQETEQNVNSSLDELVKVAAEAIISISSSDLQSDLHCITVKPSEVSTQDPLGWFAMIVSSSGYTTITTSSTVSRGKNVNENASLEEIDYLEWMTLNLIECREEEYIPQPLVPENIKIEEIGTSLLTSRPRRGQARRGRQRRDFQRDILPGLVSLSRHEVTEDLQTFGELMRATGHSWNTRLGRRTSGRGRRRSQVSSPPAVPKSAAGTPLIQQLNNGEVALEDRNLQGWEKTTRRPRRQRFPTGNLVTLPVT